MSHSDEESLIHGMRCPDCGHCDTFNIKTSQWALVDAETADTDGDIEWDNGTECDCPKCGRQGIVYEFMIDLAEDEEDQSVDIDNDSRAARFDAAWRAYWATRDDRADSPVSHHDMAELMADMLHWLERKLSSDGADAKHSMDSALTTGKISYLVERKSGSEKQTKGE